MRIGVLTGGGDCPGLNAAIRAVAQRGWAYGDDVFGVRHGWAGLLGDGDVYELTVDDIRGILHVGGTVLGTSRTNPARSEQEMAQVFENMRRYQLDALVAIGGDDTLGVAAKLHEAGLRVVGIPKTIDNDLPFTDACIGFDTATQVIAEALDRLHTTASSHHRVMVVEVMGRDVGWLAVVGGMAGGADFIAIPEEPVTLEDICEHVRRRFQGRRFSVIVVAEGAQIEGLETRQVESGPVDQFGHVRLAERGIGQRLADEIEARTGIEARVTVLGHVQRGGSPSVRDRVIGMRFGVAAVDFLHAGNVGTMTALQGNDIVPVPLSEVVGKTHTVSRELYAMAREFFIPASMARFQ
ncbi:MAG TPA: ATP-dependent 6-phosphofructokinase [Dehalococcoidia bacterium]|nr:ATP-dependent 6-phosphofructokinase [Dehalococcoidia bacterium]